MEENFFPAPAVAGQLDGMVEARLHNDGPLDSLRDQVKEWQQEYTQSYATPIYVVVDPDSGAILGRRDGSLFDEEAFAEFLRVAASKRNP